MAQELGPVIDRPLLRLIEEVLREEGYEVRVTASDGDSIPMVLAENNYFMAAATAVATLSDLALAEPYVVARLAAASASDVAGPKRWDAYALLLTQQEAIGQDFDVSGLFALAYDTSRARRIVQAGVHADSASVRRAIVPFIEPPALISEDLVVDPLTQLHDELIRTGSPPDLVERALDVYRSGGNLSDAL